MLSLLIAAIVKFSPLIVGALKSPLSGMLIKVIGHKFGVGPENLETLANVITAHPQAQSMLAEIEKEHGDILKQYSAGSQPPMMEMTIVQKFYYGASQHGRQDQASDPESRQETV